MREHREGPEHAGGEACERVRAEYLEMPGLSLTLDQARRLLMLDGRTCSALLASLVRAGFLARCADGRYVRRRGLAVLGERR